MTEERPPNPKIDTTVPQTARIAGYFEGLELVEPGLVSPSRWRPEPDPAGNLPLERDARCGVARKP